MNTKINTLAMAKEIQRLFPDEDLHQKYTRLTYECIETECLNRGIWFDDDTFPPSKYMSCPPNDKLFDIIAHKICFCDKKRSYTEVCFHFITRPCDEDITYVYCWHEDGTIKKHKIGNCPHSTYIIEKE